MNFCFGASFLFITDFSFCGDSVGSLSGYRWRDIAASNQMTNDDVAIKHAFDIRVTPTITGELCSIKLCEDGERIVCAGAGDNAIRVVAIDTGTVVVSEARVCNECSIPR